MKEKFHPVQCVLKAAPTNVCSSQDVLKAQEPCSIFHLVTLVTKGSGNASKPDNYGNKLKGNVDKWVQKEVKHRLYNNSSLLCSFEF